MRRSERYAMYATHAVLRGVLAVMIAAAFLSLAAVARSYESGPGIMLGILAALYCALWATSEAVESVRLRRIAQDEKRHEESRATRPRI